MTVSLNEPLNRRTSRPVPLTRMGFGGAPLGNLYRKVSDADAQVALQAAFDAGIRYFDTAPQYGALPSCLCLPKQVEARHAVPIVDASPEGFPFPA